MDRRVFLGSLAGGLLAAPFAAGAQQAAKVYRIGRLSLSAFDARPGHETSDAVLDGLRELGYVEGRDFLLERRDANGISDRLPKLAEELVRIPVDVLLVTGVTATAAARRATGTIPIVCMMGDPVGQGFVKSLAHPGANITGVTCRPGYTANRDPPRPVPPIRPRAKYERRWLRAGRCVACGKPRAKRTKWSPRGSKRFCPAHLRRNREYQAAYQRARRRRR
jgi:hypothetical protein